MENQSDVIRYSLNKFGLLNNPNGSEDDLERIKGTDNYKMLLTEKAFEFPDEDSESDDEFEDIASFEELGEESEK